MWTSWHTQSHVTLKRIRKASILYEMKKTNIEFPRNFLLKSIEWSWDMKLINNISLKLEKRCCVITTWMLINFCKSKRDSLDGFLNNVNLLLLLNGIKILSLNKMRNDLHVQMNPLQVIQSYIEQKHSLWLHFYLKIDQPLSFRRKSITNGYIFKWILLKV